MLDLAAQARGAATHNNESHDTDSLMADDKETTNTSQADNEQPFLSPKLSLKSQIMSQIVIKNQAFKRFVNKNLWPVTKFLDERDQCNPSCFIAAYCFQKLGIPESNQVQFWTANWGIMKSTLNQKKNSISQRLYKPFKGKNHQGNLSIICKCKAYSPNFQIL